MKRIAFAFVVVLALGTASCRETPGCNLRETSPAKPAAVSKPSFFGAVNADPRRWTTATAPRSGKALITVGDRQFATDSRTKRIGFCAPRLAAPTPSRCAAFVALRRPGVAAWVLLATKTPYSAAGKGRLEIPAVMVWKIRRSSLVLSKGVELAYGRSFSKRLESSDLQAQLEGPQTEGALLYVDAHTGEVLDAVRQTIGCA